MVIKRGKVRERETENAKRTEEPKRKRNRTFDANK